MGLELVEIVMDVEGEFGMSLPDQRLSDIRTPRQLAALVVELKCPWATDSERSRVLGRVVELTERAIGLKPGEALPDSRFVEDLGAG